MICQLWLSGQMWWDMQCLGYLFLTPPSCKGEQCCPEEGFPVASDATECPFCSGYEDEWPLVQGPPMGRFVTMTASDHLHLSLCHTSIATGLWGRRKNTDWQISCTNKTCVRNSFKVRKSAQGQSHSLSLRSLSPVVGQVIMTGDYIGCSGWPGLLMCSNVPSALHDALLNHLSGCWILLLISSILSARTIFAC